MAPQSPRPAWTLMAAAVALVIFCGLAEAVVSGRTVHFDNAVRNAIHAWASPAATSAMIDISLFGDFVILLPASLLLVVFLATGGRRREAYTFALTLTGAELSEQLLKVVFQRARPQAFFDYPLPVTYSFPSGHSFMSVCFYGLAAAILTDRARSLWPRIVAFAAAVGASALIGLSRVYLGVHYPTDVLAGYCGALVWVGSIASLVLPRSTPREGSTP